MHIACDPSCEVLQIRAHAHVTCACASCHVAIVPCCVCALRRAVQVVIVTRHVGCAVAPAVEVRVAATDPMAAATAMVPLHPLAAAGEAAAAAALSAAAAWTDKPHRPSRLPAYDVRGFVPDGMPPKRRDGAKPPH